MNGNPFNTASAGMNRLFGAEESARNLAAATSQIVGQERDNPEPNPISENFEDKLRDAYHSAARIIEHLSAFLCHAEHLIAFRSHPGRFARKSR